MSYKTNIEKNHNWIITYCEHCKDTSFEQIIDEKLTGKCYTCKKSYKTKNGNKK